jgi:mono/diheme cytochrome c family protein
LFKHERFGRATSDRFFIGIEAQDAAFDEARMQELLQAANAVAVERVYDAAKPAKVPLAFHLVGVVGLFLALIPPLWIARDRATKSQVPRIHPVRDMDFQPKYGPQAASPLFADGRAMRLPVAGTIPRGELRDDDHFYRGLVDGEFATTFPQRLGPPDMAMMRRGEQRFNIYCAPCHGLAGDGDGIISQRALAREDSPMWRPPLSLHSDAVLEQPIGQIFNTITNGVDREKNGNLSMPAYGAQISPQDRWKIILYVLALQRSRNSRTEDMPAAELKAFQLRDMEQ